MINELVRKWLIRAMDDFKMAKHELNLPDDEIVTGGVCFHCQQLVEKMLKAYLVSESEKFPKTHNLSLLLQLCIKQDSDFIKLNLGNLTFYAVDSRYADDFYTPSVDEARECFEIASTAKDFILRKMNVSERDI
ncbi:MAG: HEPN domain-containing protein [Candidatus Poribacteria bacterium]